MEFAVASKPLPSAPILQTPTQSPAPGTPILEEAAARRKKKMCKAEQKLHLAEKPQPSAQPHLQLTVSAEMILQEEVLLKHHLGSTQETTSVPGHAMKPVRHETPQAEDQGEGGVLAKKTHKENKSSPSLSTAEIPILQQEAKVTNKRKRRKQKDPSSNFPLPLDPGQAQPQGTNAPHASKPLPAAPFHEAPAQSPAPMLEEVEAEVAMGKRKMRMEQKVATLPLAQNPTSEGQAEERVLATTMTKKKNKKSNKTSLSLFAAAAAEIPILEQEVKVTKKRKTSKEQESSSYLSLPFDLGQTQPQGTNAPHASKPLPAAPFLEAPAQSPTLMLEGVEAEVAMGKRKMHTEKKVVALPLAQNPTSEWQVEERVLATKKKHKECNKTSLSLFAAAAAEIPILDQEAKVTKKRKTSKEEPSGYSPLPLDLGQTQPQGTNAPHASKPLPVASFLEAPARSLAPMLEEVEAEVAMGKRKMRMEQKVAALPLAQNSTSEGQAEERVLATTTTTKKKKKHKERNKTPLSLFAAAAAAEIPILEQEARVTKKRKSSKEQDPSGYLPLPLDLGQTQPQGTNAPHASKPLPAAPFLEAATDVVMRKRKLRKEQKVVALSLAQNTTLEEQREDAMMAKMKKQEERKPPPSTSVAAETTIWEQEAKVNKKQKQRKQQEQSGESPLPLDPGQTHSQGGKAPLEQEREADGRKDSSTKKSNGKRPHVRVLSKRELIKESSKKQPVLPEGFVAFSDFVPSCTEQNPDHPPPYIAFFDQFRYKPVRGDHNPPLPRTPDRLSRFTANETYTICNSNTSIASKTKQQDLGLGSQEKQNAQVKEKPQKKKQRKQSGNSLPIDPTQTCCVQIQGTPEQDEEADARKVDNIKKSNGNKPRVRAPSKHELFKEQMLPELSELSANGTSKATNSVARKSKKKDSYPGSASGSQEKLHANEKKNPEKKQRKPPPLLTRAEKCSDKYRRVPLDQLIPPPRSPHNLLQEKYASDPWKVIVICMLLNLTQGIQVKRIIEGFFECYPDAQSACNADPDKMAGYLAPLGLQHVKTTRIQRFSKEYVEKEWTYITELCGVGKYAADAYAIFCAGRATEVVPKDHKLVDYWKYVCFELPMMQGS